MTHETPSRIAIVGTGGMATQRAAALKSLPTAALSAVVSRDPDRAAAFAKEHGGRPFTSWEEAIHSDAVTAVFVCTPNDSHPEIALAALEAGKHTLVEYALARTTAEGRPLLVATEKSGAVLHVGHTHRLGGSHRILKAGLKGLGTMLTARFSVLYGRKARKWFPDPERLGSVFVGAMLHFNDQLQDLFGAVRWVDAHLEMETDANGLVDWDVANATFAFSGGGLAQVTYGRGLTPPGWEYEARIACRNGYVEWKPQTNQWVRVGAKESRSLSVPAVDTVLEDTRNFIDTISGRARPYITPGEALNAVSLGEAAAKAAREGRRVYLED